MNINDLNQNSHFPIIDIQISHPIEINAENIEYMDVSDRETIIKLSNFIINKKYDPTNELHKLGFQNINLKLNHKINEIKSDNTGVKSYFNYYFGYFFRPNVIADEKQSQLARMETLKKFIEPIINLKAMIQAPAAADTQQILPNNGPIIQENIEEKEKLNLDKQSESDDQPAKISLPLSPLSNEKPLEEETLIPSSPAEKKVIPPPPPKRPVSLTPEQLHEKREKERLSRELQERAQPEMFYVITPPKDEAKLMTAKEKLEKEIRALSDLLSATQPSAQRTLQGLIDDKHKEIENINQQLEGTKVRLKPSDQEFLTTIQKYYTNHELKLFIGMVFNGKRPNEEDPLYSEYKKNKAVTDLLDEIFNNWEEISKGEIAEAFLANAEGWKKCVSYTFFGFASILQKRLSEKKSEHLDEPIHEMKPFKRGAAAKKSPLTEMIALPLSTAGFMDQLKESLAQGVPLLRKTPIELPAESTKTPPSGHDQLQREIIQGIQLRKVGPRN